MFLLLNQPSKTFVGSSRLPILSSQHNSSSSLPQTPPCRITCLQDFDKLQIQNANEHFSTNVEKWVSYKLLGSSEHFKLGKLATIGSSHGWVATLKDGRVRLLDDLNPVASDSDRKRISMPPLVTLPNCQTEIVTNVSMTSSSPEDEDCVVAINFMGPQLSFCRPAQSNPEWINITIKSPCFFSSSVMFSQRDGMFRIPASRGHLIGSWDLGEHKDDPKIQTLRFSNLVKPTEAEREILHSCFTSEHLVESPTTGETFLLKWYKKSNKSLLGIPKLKTEALMVFKVDEKGNVVYTEDIGDLVIFLSKVEPLCAPASSFPGLHPNIVRIIDVDETATVDLATRTISTKMTTHNAPYWIPPQDIEI